MLNDSTHFSILSILLNFLREKILIEKSKKKVAFIGTIETNGSLVKLIKFVHKKKEKRTFKWKFKARIWKDLFLLVFLVCAGKYL